MRKLPYTRPVLLQICAVADTLTRCVPLPFTHSSFLTSRERIGKVTHHGRCLLEYTGSPFTKRRNCKNMKHSSRKQKSEIIKSLGESWVFLHSLLSSDQDFRLCNQKA